LLPGSSRSCWLARSTALPTWLSPRGGWLERQASRELCYPPDVLASQEVKCPLSRLLQGMCTYALRLVRAAAGLPTWLSPRCGWLERHSTCLSGRRETSLAKCLLSRLLQRTQKQQVIVHCQLTGKRVPTWL
jgi:hypothetical protein